MNPKVMETMIKKYPIVFPDEVDSSVPAPSNDFKSIVTELLNKDPKQRIGSDQFENEILQHAYFEQ